jgi:arginine-tRNA-protein transferase
LPLEGYQFRKRLRKLMNRNELMFRTCVRPARLDEEKEALFQVYKENFKGLLSPSLKVSLQDNYDYNIFSTYEIAVYHGERLAAFSFFDLGKDSLASIKGVYHPDFEPFSLGYFTMLHEIKYGQELGFKYYYPGYIVPGFPRFDYKTRIGKEEEVEYFDLKTHAWLPLSSFTDDCNPVHYLSQKLVQAGWALSQHNIACQVLFYPAYEANIFGYGDERFLESPLFLNCFYNVFPRPRFIIYFDIWKEKYVFCHCMPVEDLGFYFEYSMQFDTGDAKHFLDFLMKKTVIAETDDVQEIMHLAVGISRLLKPQSKLRRFLK